MADLTRTLDLSPGPLGLALFVGASASILAMACLGWTADRLGRRAFLMVTGCVIGFGIAGLALAGGYAALLLTLIVLYSASGLYDVGITPRRWTSSRYRTGASCPYYTRASPAGLWSAPLDQAS